MFFDRKHLEHRAQCLVRLSFLTLLLLPTLGWGQHYEISGQSSLTGVFTLTVYDGDSTTHTFTLSQYGQRAGKNAFSTATSILLKIDIFKTSQKIYNNMITHKRR